MALHRRTLLVKLIGKLIKKLCLLNKIVDHLEQLKKIIINIDG